MKFLSVFMFSIFSNSSAATDDIIGKSCTLHDGTEGSCKNYKNCAWAENQLEELKISYKNLVLCGYEGEDVVICCMNGEFSRAAVKRKSEKACDEIEAKNKLLFYFGAAQGIPVVAGQYKHMSALGYYDNKLKRFMYMCGGSLISLNFIITSASCVDGKYLNSRIVKLGRVTLSENVRFEDEIEQNILIKNIIIHPKYTYKGKYNDIALIELSEPAIKTDAIGLACLYSGESDLYEKNNLMSLGWGDTLVEKRNLKMLLKDQSALVPTIDCNEILLNETTNTKYAIEVKETQLCAASENENDTQTKLCQFGNGGPIQFDSEDKDYIVGVKSFSMTCNSTITGVFTRIDNHLDWIEGIVWPDVE